MNAEAAKESNHASHRVTVTGRETLEVSGVTDVVSFDEQAVVLNTVCGGMEIDGASLHIHVLNIEQGTVAMDGRVDSVSYYETEVGEKTAKSGFFGKLFR